MGGVRVRAVAAVAALAAAAAVLATGPGQAAPAAPAPDFTLELFNGQRLRLADLKGTGVILLFWAPW